ncbi:MAG: cupin domain-containing protein [Thermodesulfobacteriota bacterium]
MGDIVVIRFDEVEARPLPGAETEAGWIKRMVYPPAVATRNTFLGVGETGPGFSPHRWHRHVHDRAEGYEVRYPESFEEVYFILSGTGLIQWKNERGEVEEAPVGPGDTIFMPQGVAEHQLFNPGPDNLRLLFCGCPLPEVTFTK